ncbi:hypothetical protein K469DRAFT_696577 [Zopfia rhizophila CBS 207.26]|uniref:Zn(2)-C6 fungal-type domain-containing protein n=1 Tax=Zopfia rhizophila CBS 207.26 TaxID=1314779 RepID=A0A6A6DGG6_9PEZI|nr:hypothetical protein K469DRAFT_696577 [Zopfia rhizophila CBS 207.26]
MHHILFTTPKFSAIRSSRDPKLSAPTQGSMTLTVAHGSDFGWRLCVAQDFNGESSPVGGTTAAPQSNIRSTWVPSPDRAGGQNHSLLAMSEQYLGNGFSSYPMTDAPQNPGPKGPVVKHQDVGKRNRIPQAWGNCRCRKQRCSGGEPCQYCKKENSKCVYGETPLGPPRDSTRRLASTPDTAASFDAQDPVTLEQRMVKEEPPENPDWIAPASSLFKQTQCLTPGPNGVESPPNPVVPIRATSLSEGIHHTIPILHRIKVHEVDSFLGFRISLPAKCLESVPNGRQMLSSRPILMSSLLYLLTDFTYNPYWWDLTEARSEVRNILEEGIRPYVAKFLPIVPDCDPDRRLVELTSLLGMRVSLRTGQVVYLRGLHPDCCVIQNEAGFWVVLEQDILGPVGKECGVTGSRNDNGFRYGA